MSVTVAGKPRIRVRVGETGGRPVRQAGLETAAPYDAGDALVSAIASWRPMREHPDSEIGEARDVVTARARDLARNNGWAAGAVQKEVDAVVGAQFRPTAEPDWRALGIDRDTAKEVALQMDAAWRAWADDPRLLADATRAHSFGGMAGLAYRSYAVDGDALGVLHWEEGDRPFATQLRVLDADLLSNPNNVMDGPDMRGGVELDAQGASLAYHFRTEHEFALWSARRAWTWQRIERETSWGRPVVVHFFDKVRDGQTRGISRFAPILDALKMEDKFSRVELQAAVLSAILGVFVTSSMDPETVAEMLTESPAEFDRYQMRRLGLHDAVKPRFGNVRIPVLPPGDAITTVKAERPSANFNEFEGAVLRRIAAGWGISYEQLAADWSKVNYSSARAALIEIWRGLTARRIAFAQRWCQPVRLALLEEAVDRGMIRLPRGAPDFYDAIGPWCRAKWIGPGRGYVDPVKEAQAAALRVSLGLSTMEDEAAELSGADYADNLAQIEREIEEMPEGVLHPAQERFTELLGASPDGPTDRRGEAA